MVIILRGKMIEAVNVRGSEEHFNLEARALRAPDLWTPSAFETFRIITDNARSAIMHFYTAGQLDTSLRSFLVIFFELQYLICYSNLLIFSAMGELTVISLQREVQTMRQISRKFPSTDF